MPQATYLVIRVSALMALLLSITACKLQITVPEGGSVVSESGAYRCEAGQTCDIDVIDYYFEETFLAEPMQGYFFRSWEGGDRLFCGTSTSKSCFLTTSSHGYLDDVAFFGPFLESDEVFYLRPRFEKGSCRYTGTDNILDISWGDAHSYYWNEPQECYLPSVFKTVKHGRFVEYNTVYGAQLRDARLVVCQSDYDIGTLVRQERWVFGLTNTFPGGYLRSNLVLRANGTGEWTDYDNAYQIVSRREFVTRVDVCEEA